MGGKFYRIWQFIVDCGDEAGTLFSTIVTINVFFIDTEGGFLDPETVSQM